MSGVQTNFLDGQPLSATQLNAAFAACYPATGNGGVANVSAINVSGIATAYAVQLSNSLGGTLLSMDSPAGFTRAFNITTAGLSRWSFYATGTPESGSNAGTDLVLACWADDGITFLSNPISVTRATGAVTMTGTVTAGALTVTGGGAIGTTGTITAGAVVVASGGPIGTTGTVSAGSISCTGTISAVAVSSSGLGTSGTFVLSSQTNGAASSTATMTNAPAAGNPVFWVPIYVNGTLRHFPVW